MTTLHGKYKAIYGRRHLLLLNLYLIFSFLRNFTAAAINKKQYSPLVSFRRYLDKPTKVEISGRGLTVCALEEGSKSMDESDYLDSFALVTGRYSDGGCYP